MMKTRRGRESYRHQPLSLMLRILVLLSAILSFGLFLFLIGFILYKGVPHLSPDLFSLPYTSDNVSMMPALLNTLIMTLLSLLISIPLGVGASIYIVEYAPKNSRLTRLVRAAAETLSGIPSIIYGLFGMLFFVVALGWGYSLLAGAFTLSIMVLPLIMRTTEEALHAIPEGYREGSYGLGAGKLRTILKIVLPASMPGILAGIVLATGRIIGETAALIYTAGTVATLPESLFSSARTLSVHLYVLSNEGLHVGEAYATAVVLLLIVLFINTISAMLAKRVSKG